MEQITAYRVAISQEGCEKTSGYVRTESEAKSMVENISVFRNIEARYKPVELIRLSSGHVYYGGQRVFFEEGSAI
jgi:hypothetical protein